MRRAGVAAIWGTAALVVLALALNVPLTDHLFKGVRGLVFCFAIALVTYCFQHLTRGTLSGNGRFGPYGIILGAEGAIRLAPALILALAGVDNPVYFGLALAIPPALASAFALRGQRDLMTPGPEAPWSELSTNLGFLLTGSLFAQALSYAPILAATILASGDDHGAVAAFVSAFFLARIPILLFQAVQAALLPKLARLLGAGAHADFRSGLRKLLLVVVSIGLLGIVGGFTLGPLAGEILFDKSIDRSDLALLCAGSGAFILALTLAQALIALVDHAKATLAWGIGIAIGAISLVVQSVAGVELFLRIELSFLAASLGSALVMAAFLRGDSSARCRRRAASASWRRSSTNRSRSKGELASPIWGGGAGSADRRRRKVGRACEPDMGRRRRLCRPPPTKGRASLRARYGEAAPALPTAADER